MTRLWYIHKWYWGEHRGAWLVSRDHDIADRVMRNLAASHGPAGWSYAITDSDREPPQTVDRFPSQMRGDTHASSAEHEGQPQGF